METTKHLLVSEICREFRGGDEAKTKKVLEEISNQSSVQLTDTEDLNLGLITFFMTQSEKQLESVLGKHGIMLKDVMIKVLASIMKSMPTSTRCSMP